MIELKAGMTIVTETLDKGNTYTKTWLLIPICNFLVPRLVIELFDNGHLNLGCHEDLDILKPHIIKVYEPIDKLDFGDTDSSLLVWKKETPEYTMEELQNKLGHSFKIKR